MKPTIKTDETLNMEY